jgi:hypothetical protein
MHLNLVERKDYAIKKWKRIFLINEQFQFFVSLLWSRSQMMPVTEELPDILPD